MPSNIVFTTCEGGLIFGPLLGHGHLGQVVRLLACIGLLIRLTLCVCIFAFVL